MIRSGTHLRPPSQGPESAEGVAGGTLNSLAARKTQLRRELRAARKSILAPLARRAARRAANHLLRGLTRRAERIALYLASGSELDTAPLLAALHRRGLRVFVPSVHAHRDGRMRLVALEPHAPLRRKRFGIREPAARRGTGSRVDVLILPLLGFDARGTRLGSGAGYYDRWLARQRPRPLCIGYAYALQGCAELPTEPWDRPLDAICTEQGLRWFVRR